MTPEIDQSREIPQGVEQPKAFDWRVVSREEVSGVTKIIFDSNINLGDIPECEDLCGECESPMRKGFVNWPTTDSDHIPTPIRTEARVPGYICQTEDRHLGFFDERSLLGAIQAVASEYRYLGSEELASGLEYVYTVLSTALRVNSDPETSSG